MTTPTADQIREAAATSPEAKAALMRLFPEVFAPKALSMANVNYRAFLEAFRDTPLAGSIDVAASRDGLYLNNPPDHQWDFTPAPWRNGFYLRCIQVSD